MSSKFLGPDKESLISLCAYDKYEVADKSLHF